MYHLPTNSEIMIVILYIIANLFFNAGLCSLLFTTFVFQFSSHLEKKFNYLVYGLFFIISVGFIFWQPEVNQGAYANGTVSTDIFLLWDLFINIIRMAIITYSLIVFASGPTKSKLRYLSFGLFFAIVGTILIMIGFEEKYLLETIIKGIGMIIFNVCTVLIYREFKIGDRVSYSGSSDTHS